jgi:Histidine kinase-, DNA gyrase B-, and HSP90-like ATPase
MPVADGGGRAMRLDPTTSTFVRGCVLMAAEEEEAPVATGETGGYVLRISRLTIDKLGVKLYDKVSAAVAELIANSYDADATEVEVQLPLGTELATKDKKTKEPVDKGFEIIVKDNGHGMTPTEARQFYLEVGRDRRGYPEQGGTSREKHRPVMGRKGIGKLAPFGICRVIEVISAGGGPVDGKGYLVTHFFLEFDKIVQDTDAPVPLEVGDKDETYADARGTTIRLTKFLPKRVPDADTFHRQLATRFALAATDFEIKVTDTKQSPPTASTVEQFQVAVSEATKVDVSSHPVPAEDGEKLPVTGWLAMAKEAYKNEEGAGVRIYARGKIVATTRDFEQPAGFTGEFTMRSYLVGEIHADWLDEDDGEDLIRTDRQSILWDSERGQALKDWGGEIIKQIAKASSKPRRERKSKLFMEQANIKQRAEDRYGDEAVVAVAVELGDIIGAFAAEDELADPEYVDDLAEVVLTVAPHQALVSAFKEISHQEDATMDQLLTLFGKTRVAEMASYSQIAAQRVRSVKELQEIINKPGVEEADLQQLIASAPWLIHPDWSLITENQQLKTFRDQFTLFWKKKYGEDLEVAISFEKKRPDFTLVHHGRQLHIVEIKTPGHKFSAADYERLQNYVDAFTEFFAEHESTKAAFPDEWVIDLIADGVNLTNSTQQHAFDAFVEKGRVLRQTWNDFLASATAAHEAFLDAHEKAHQEPSE